MKLYLTERVGIGGFSCVYAANVTASSSPPPAEGAVVAVKKMHITKHTPNSVLRHEACIYLLLAGHASVPEYYDYLALELLGNDVRSVRNGLTLRNFAVLACAMLDAVEHVHAHGLVHCDIKPTSFLFCAGGRLTLKLIDFGLATPFRDLGAGGHRDERATNHLRGTARYASIGAHMHRTPARRDDLASLSYTLAELARGSLPWARVRAPADILRYKAAWPSARAALPACPALADFACYARDLPFAAAPDYARWRDAFRALVPIPLPPDAVFDPADDGPRVRGDDVGVDEDDAGPPPETTLVAPPSVDSPSDVIPDSDDGWVPTMTWPPPTSVPAADLIGDEQATVRACLQHIEEPPAMDKPWLWECDSPEAMQTL